MIIRIKKNSPPQPRLRLVPKKPESANRESQMADSDDAPTVVVSRDESSAANHETRTTNHETRATKRILRDQPPDIPFLQFDSIAGRGGMAVVWRAWHKEMNRWVAVKVLDENFASSGEEVRQFMAEVSTMTNLRHPGIVRGYGADCADGRWFFIMDFVSGYTFGSLLHRKSRIGQADACIIGESVADAMGYAWRDFRIVHCDIKPENVMVDRDGSVKVTDLGLCQTTNAMRANAPASDEVVGTPAYISPEQVYGDVQLDCRADVYSLGATLYHLTAGRMLFAGMDNEAILRAHVDPASAAPDARTLSPALTLGFSRLLAKMLVKDRDAGRYASWEEVAADVRRVEDGDDLEPLPPGVVSSMRLA